MPTTNTSLHQIAAGMAAGIEPASKPRSPHAHLVPSSGNARLFIPNGSRLYSLDDAQAARLQALLDTHDDDAITQELFRLGLDVPPFIDDSPPDTTPLYALSLAIAQKCNLGCHYCYAGQGQFGAESQNMSPETARQAIDLLMAGCPDNGSVQLSFLGGEPLTNRTGVREATEYACRIAAQRNITVRFSLTSNGTLLTPDDALFFEAHRFAVTISLDGREQEHDRQRPMKSGKGSYALIMQKIAPLLSIQRQMQVSARITVSSVNIDLPATLEEFIQKGFHSVGFSPLLRAHDGKNEMGREDLQHLLTQMIECGLRFERATLGGQRYPFLNMLNALKEIDRGTHRPYPCGAGAGYMGVSANGQLFACHRFVNEPRGRMGDLETGIDTTRQRGWLQDRHVNRQQPCTQCWARYLCGGGCHHEVIEKGRTACDYIRGWLHYAIQAHERLTRLVPYDPTLTPDDPHI